MFERPQVVSGHASAGRRVVVRRWGLLVAAALLLTATACKSGRTAAAERSATAGRYERKPIKETTDERLRTETRMIEAKMLAETGQPEAAMALYRQLLGEDTTLAAASFELSRLMASGGMVDSALVLARRAARQGKDNKWYLLHLASLQRYVRDFGGLTETMERVVSVEPEELAYYYELSDAYLLEGNGKKAVGALNRVEKRVGITEEVSMQKYKILKKMGQEAQAMRELEALAEAQPGDAHLNGMLAEAYMAAGEYQKAKRCYDRVQETAPDDEYIHISMAEYYKAVKEPQKAFEELRKGMREPRLSTTNKLRILTNFYTQEEFYGTRSREALQLLETAMEGSADSVAFAAFYGDLLMHNERYAEAAHQFGLALRGDSSRYEVWEALLVSELSANMDTAVLMRDAQRAAKLFPLHQLPLYVQGAVHHEAGRYVKALELLNRCEELGFDKGYLEPEVYLLKAECMGQIGYRECYDYYERYLKLRPGDMNARNSYAYRLAVNGHELEKAKAMSQQTLKAEPDNHYYLDTYAWILHQMGNDKEALLYMRKAMEKGARSPEVMMHWMVIAAKNGMDSSALPNGQSMQFIEMKGQKVEGQNGRQEEKEGE